MKILLAIAILQTLNLVVFICLDRVMLLRLLLLRRQLAVCKRGFKRSKLRNRDRLFWSLVSRILKDWRTELELVKPETVIRWRKRRLREFWRERSQSRIGRPSIPRKHIYFIQRISSDHPEYGENRIALELELKFGIRHSSATVRKYMAGRRTGPPDSQAWRTFLKNQASALWACDFFVQYTVDFRILYVFVVLELGTRKVVHFNVTQHPTLAWVKQQVRNTCFDEQPKFLIHDNDGEYGQLAQPIRLHKNALSISWRSSLDIWLFEVISIRGIPTPYHARNASAHAERLIGTLRRVLGEFIRWYNRGRVHQGLHGIPDPDFQLEGPFPEDGELAAIPILNGLHHDYRLVA